MRQIRYFAIYTCWIAAFAMSGPLLHDDLLLQFLIPHTLTALAFAFTPMAAGFGRLLPVSTWSCGLGTALYPFAGANAPLLMSCLGILSVPIALRALIALKETTQPLVSAVIALALGHALMLIMVNVIPPVTWIGPVVLGVLVLSLATFKPADARFTHGSQVIIPSIMGAIFFFQIFSGLMYGRLFPAYAKHGLFPETHWVMLFYSLGVLLALPLTRRNPTLSLVAGIFVALIGFALWRMIPQPAAATVGMAATLFAAGIVDMVFLAQILAFRNQIRAGGFGLAILCGGIAFGIGLTVLVEKNGETIGMIGMIMLNLAMITLYVVGIRRTRHQDVETQATDVRYEALPFVARLSEQEKAVLPYLAGRDTYREIAQSLQVSESTIKTYVQRIYRKSGVYSRHQLRHLLTTNKVQNHQVGDLEN